MVRGDAETHPGSDNSVQGIIMNQARLHSTGICEPLEGRISSIFDSSHLRPYVFISPSHPQCPDLHDGLASSGSYPGRLMPAFCLADSRRLPQPWSLHFPSVYTSPPTGRCQDRLGNVGGGEGRRVHILLPGIHTRSPALWASSTSTSRESLQRNRPFVGDQEATLAMGSEERF